MSDFVHLHVHTEFSLLDGLSRIDKLVARAKELNMPAVAITDHGTMFGVIDFFKACKAADVKPVIGVEAYLSRRGMEDKDPKLDKKPYHMLMLAQDMDGYRNLLKIVSDAQLRGYYYRPRIDKAYMREHAKGIIATSGCLAAEIPSMVMAGRGDEAMQMVGEYQDIFGVDNFYLELQQHRIDELDVLNKWLMEYRKSNHTNIQLIATNDVHYVMEDDYDPHDTLLCIQTSALKTDTDRLKMTDASYHLTSSEETWRNFSWLPEEMRKEAMFNTLKIAEMCNVDLNTQGYHLPVFPVPGGHTSTSYMRYLCEKGLQWRFQSRASEPILVDRLNHELNIIRDMGFETYFLIVWDLCQYAVASDIWWNVRGSGAGSLVAYCLGITKIDPIENNLLFERFLNPGRVSMPDIDMDFPDDRRGEMISYTARKYGEDKVAAIITFGTMGPKAAVRDVGRALNVDKDLVNLAARLIPQEPKPKPLMEYVENNPELKTLVQNSKELQSVFATAVNLQGVNRHASIHAAGIIVADKPLVEYVPLHRMTGTNPSKGAKDRDKEKSQDEGGDASQMAADLSYALKAVTQFPMETCESLGLLKIDFLGLSTLTSLRKACELIEHYQGIHYDMDNIPYRHDHLPDEESRKKLDEAFKLMGRGQTVGVFQFEGAGMRQMLRDMRPTRYEHIIAAVSLYRPGPMEFIPAYNRRLRGEEAVEFKHPKLEPILAETYAIITYQEQIMQIASELFGYELGEADLMRKAVSKKKEKDLMKHRSIFLDRGPKNGVDEQTAGAIFDEIEFFANYGFNKSHAADYAFVAMQSAFLKAHYPAEFMTALLIVHSDDSAKVATFLTECREMDIPILPPDVTYSNLNFDIQPLPDGKRGIRFGMIGIKGAGEAALKYLIDARADGGTFPDLEDFCRRVDLRAVGKRTLESLAKVGALDSFGDANLPEEDRRVQIVEAVERMVRFSHDQHEAQKVGQMSIFGDTMKIEADFLQPVSKDKRITRRDMLKWEKDLLGLYATGRPADKIAGELQNAGTMDIAELKESTQMQDKPVRIAGEIVSIRTIVTKDKKMMAVAQVEDWHATAGIIEAVFFPKTWDKFGSLIEASSVRIFSGKYDSKRGDPQIIVEGVFTSTTAMTSGGGDGTWQPNSHNAVPSWAEGAVFVSDKTYDEPPPRTYDEAPARRYEEAPPLDYDDMGEVAMPAYVTAPPVQEVVIPATQGAAASPSLPAEPPLVTLPTPQVETATVTNSATPWMKELDREAEWWFMVYLPRSGSDDKDRRVFRKVHWTLTSYPGKDRFTIMVEQEGKHKPKEMQFPNHRTHYCQELINELVALLGESNVEIFPRPR